MAEGLKIAGFATLAAILYGELHDQVTAHICVEYFSVAHPPLFRTSSPFLLALGWGIIATWWVGLPLGVLLAAGARLGSAPKLCLVELRRPIGLLMAASAVIAFAAGVTGATLVALRITDVPGGWGAIIPPPKWAAFSGDAWAHLASYISGALGGLLVVALTIRRRLRMRPSRSNVR